MFKKCRRIKRKRLIFLISVVLFFLAVWFFLSYSVNPVIRKISEEKVRELASMAVNNAATEVIIQTAGDYSKLIEISKNDEGEIELMQINSMFLSILSRDIITKSQSNISGLGSQGIGVPIGSLSGLPFLTGHGPDVKIKVYPVGSVDLKFKSEFASAGINQTRHAVKMHVFANVSVIMPGSNKTIYTQTEVMLAESIIIGKVPSTYLNSTSLDEMMNLIP